MATWEAGLNRGSPDPAGHQSGFKRRKSSRADFKNVERLLRVERLAELTKESFWAASLLDLGRLQHCLESGVNVRSLNELKETLLHVALHAVKTRIKLRHYRRQRSLHQQRQEESCGGTKWKSKDTDDELEEKCEEEVVKFLIEAGSDVNSQDFYGNTCMHIACNDSMLHIQALMYELAKPDISVFSYSANTRPLDDACKMGHLKTVEMLLGHLDDTLEKVPSSSVGSGARKKRNGNLTKQSYAETSTSELKSALDCVNEDAYTALHYAVMGGNPDVVSFLLAKGADPLLGSDNDNGQKKTPLHLAAVRGQTDIAEMLADANGLLVNLEDIHGNTALHVAVLKEKVDVVEVLVSKGANLKAKNEAKRTPLDEALLRNPVNEDIVDLLKNKTSKKKTKDMAKKEQSSNLFSKLTEIKDIGGKFLKKDREKNKEYSDTEENKEELDPQSLEFVDAASVGNCGVIVSCLKQGVNPDVQNSAGETALHIIIEQGHPDLHSLLATILEAGASPDVTTNNKQTPLHYAASTGSSVAMKLLLDRNADPNIQDVNGETPLFTLATEKLTVEQSMTCGRLLVKHGANVNLADDNGLTPLHVASKYGKKGLMKLFMENRADPAIVDANGRTPLHHIFKLAHDSHDEYIKILVPSHGHPMIDIKNKTGDAPLHMAARNQCPNTMISLLEMGADPNLVSGKVPRQMALELLYQDFLVNKNEDHEITNDFSIAESIAEPELIVKSPSPILTAMNYSKIFAHIAESKDNNATYATLSASCEDLTVDLIQTCRNMDDARILLQHKDYFLYKTASQDQHKKFMYATYMQRFLQEVWYGKVFKSYKTWRLVLYPTIYILSPIIYPIMLLVYLFLCLLFGVWVPRNRDRDDGCYAWRKPFQKYFRFFSLSTKYSPYIKFVGHLTSFLCFILVVSFKCLLPFDFRNPMPVPAVDFIILLWTAGMITNEAKQYRMSSSFAAYMTVNYLDFIFLTTLTISYTMQFIALFYTIANNYDISDEEYNTTAQWVIIILMIADVIFALNTLIIFGRLLTYFQVSPFLGPLQISLFRMAWDVIFVLVILGIVMFAFAASMTKVYMVGLYTIPPGLNDTELQERLYPSVGPPLIPDTVSSMGATLVSLYWSLYGLLDVEDFESYYSVSNAVGKALLGLYLILAVIVLLNMLIAKISNTYANIQENSRVEWNYAKATLIIEYQESQDLPIPFNFIQTIVRAIIRLFRNCGRCCKRSKVVDISTEPDNTGKGDLDYGEENLTFLDDGGMNNVNGASPATSEAKLRSDIDQASGSETNKSSGNDSGKVTGNGSGKTSGNGSTKAKEKERELAEEKKEVDRILAYVKADYLKKQEEAMRYSLKELHNKMNSKMQMMEEKLRMLWNEVTTWKTNTNAKMKEMHKNFTNTQEVLRKHLQKKFAEKS